MDRTLSEGAVHWSLSLILPAYNESASIGQALLEADNALRRLTPQYEILVVDDGSSDGTAELTTAWQEKLPCVRLLRHAENRGYGAGLRTGFDAARYDYVAFTDADCQFDLSDLGRLLPLLERWPLVVGYRQRRQDPWRRLLFSWGYNLLVRCLLGTRVRDVDCALKVFRRGVLAQLLPESSGYFVNAEMLTRARQLGFAVAELPVIHRPRQRGGSKVSLRDIPRVLGVLLPFWWSRVLLGGKVEVPPQVFAARVRVAAPAVAEPAAVSPPQLARRASKGSLRSSGKNRS